MSRYVATLIDVTALGSAGAPADFAEFALPSSEPIPCTETVAFARVRPDHAYSALVNGYSHNELEPMNPGSPTMVDPDNGEVITPDWTTRCGDPNAIGADAPAMARSRATVYVRGCDPLVRATTTRATFDMSSALGDLGCGTEVGQVSSYRLLTGDEVLVEGACEESAATIGIPSDGGLSALRLEAFEHGSPSARWGATCLVPRDLPKPEVDCEPLDEQGSVSFDLAALLDGTEIDCSSNARLTVTEGDRQLLEKAPIDCTSPLVVTGLEAGEHAPDIIVTSGAGDIVLESACTALVVPGLVAAAACTPVDENG